MLRLVPFIPSPIKAVELGLAEACVGEGDVFADMGSGDGRVVAEAARRGAVSIGFEIDPFLVMLSKTRIRELGLEDRASIHHMDMFNVSLRGFTVIYQYLYPSISHRLSPKYERELPPGARIVALDLPIPKWTPIKMRRLIDEAGILRTIFIYIVGYSNPSSIIVHESPIPPRAVARIMGLENCGRTGSLHD